MEKLTTHTPKYLGIPSGVWPTHGGARSSSKGVVIGLINTGISPNHPSFASLSSLSSNSKLLNHSSHTALTAAGNNGVPVTVNGYNYGFATGMVPGACLSIGSSTVPPGLTSFFNVLEMQLLFATRAGIVVIQAARNGGPSASSILSFSPWITSVAASITDRKYNDTLILGNGQS
ncbi:hypothetical protein Ancab_015606 [Ancistrocladus abbreviatus]